MMGMEDRDYYWEDRKRRENKFSKKDTHYRPKEFRRKDSQISGKPPNDWHVRPDVARQQWKFLFAFLAGGLVAFWTVLVILHLNADLLFVPYEATRKVLSATGLL
ncbi:hypothetical protein ACFPTY_11750 [Halomonas beimenensis]|uniref:hypothetical protein n=1 Tax=Halomonas beimenensis TaxID=475662 RepID=UPI00129077B5|nr:hypothetical protein [Halomonas beimenensis]